MGLIFSVYNKFKLRKWLNYSAGKRQRLIEKVEKKQAKKLKRPILPVVVNTSPNCPYFGMFESNNGKQILHINLRLLNEPHLRFHALETILHEGRHAYQYNLINKRKIRFFEFRKKRWLDNYSGYISSNEDKLFYSMQPIERDAQKYAIKKMEKMHHRFKDEEDYHLTLELMKKRFDKTEEELRAKHGLFYRAKLRRKIKSKLD